MKTSTGFYREAWDAANEKRPPLAGAAFLTVKTELRPNYGLW